MGGEKKTLAMDLKSPDALSILPTNGNDVRGVAPLPSVCTYFERVGNGEVMRQKEYAEQRTRGNL